jgi:EpsI family protein
MRMSGQANSWMRFLLALALIGGTGLLLRARNRGEGLPPRQPLSTFPVRVGEWTGSDVVLQQDVLRVLGDGEFLERTYFRSFQEPPIDLFLAFFPSQRTGSTIHSPQNCLPGAGWAPLASDRSRLASPTGQTITVNRYLIGKGLDRQVVLYWYQSHGRAVASEYWAKFYLVTDAVRMNRSDAALVRVLTPLSSGESFGAGEKRASEFVYQILPGLDRYIPR